MNSFLTVLLLFASASVGNEPNIILARVGEASLTLADVKCDALDEDSSPLSDDCRVKTQSRINEFVFRHIVEVVASHFEIAPAAETLALDDAAKADLAEQALRFREIFRLIGQYRSGSLDQSQLQLVLSERWRVTQSELDYYLSLIENEDDASFYIKSAVTERFLDKAQENQRLRVLSRKIAERMQRGNSATPDELAKRLITMAEVKVVEPYRLPDLSKLFRN